MQRKIFLSYSQKDREYFDAFRKHLAPFERMGLILAWSDLEIRPSEDWDRKIRDAMNDAEAAVLLVSPDMLATDYVVELEIPRLVEASEAGQLLLTSLFLRPSNPDALVFDILDQKTGEFGIRITKYQGLNRPTEPVAELPPAERDKVLADCARKVWDMLAARPSRREQRRTLKSRELTVELRVQGNQVFRCYSKPRVDNLLQNHGGIDMPHLLARARGNELDSRLESALFEVLLGPERQWQEVLRKAHGEEGGPIRHGVRLRILTDDAELQGLPWPRCRWRGYALADEGWTFELAAGREPPPRIWLDAPCTALMVGAEAGGTGSLRVEAHRTSFQALLDRAWDHPLSTKLFRYAETPEELWTRLDEQPRLVYVYGRVRRGEDGPELVLRDDEGQPRGVAFARLSAALAEHPPGVVFFNTLGECPVASPISGVPVLLHQRHVNAELARTLGQIWWSDVLGGRWDPVKAFHDLGTEARHRGTVRTHYETWETRLSDVTPKVDRPRSRLDRRVQREAVMSVVRDLVQNRHRRVSCVVVYGSEGNLVEHFAFQVVDTLKDWARDMARIQKNGLRFPAARDTWTPETFLDVFRDLMHLQPYQDLNAAFKQQLGGPSAVPVHFLDWGCYGEGRQRTLRASHLEAWLGFCCDHLPGACQGRSRILSYVALVVPAERQARLRRLLDGLSQQERFRPVHFEMRLLQPLEKITPQDLRAFLAVEDNTSCPPEYRHDIAERICHETGGEFEATVRLLEEAEHGMMWPELHLTLPEAESAPVPSGDPEL